MGLDMYLMGKKYIKAWDHRPDPVSDAIVALKIPGMGEMKPMYIECEAIYWRKANEVHQYFVDHVQKGVDDCGHYYVSVEVLEDLLDRARQILIDPKKGPELLPTQGGFFFGSTDYDEGYLEGMRYTVKSLEKLLATPDILEQWEFYYHSSW